MARADKADVTPFDRRCGIIGRPGMPVWSPDGRKLAIGAYNGVYLMNTDGTKLRQVWLDNGRGIFGDSRPSWGPDPHTRRPSGHPNPNCAACN